MLGNRRIRDDQERLSTKNTTQDVTVFTIVLNQIPFFFFFPLAKNAETNLWPKGQPENPTVSKEKLIQRDEESFVPDGLNRAFSLWNLWVVFVRVKHEIKNIAGNSKL